MEGPPGNSEGMAGLLLCGGEDTARWGRSVSASEGKPRGVLERADRGGRKRRGLTSGPGRSAGGRRAVRASGCCAKQAGVERPGRVRGSGPRGAGLQLGFGAGASERVGTR